MMVKFWGVHGSLPRPGHSTLKFGGNTSCVEVRSENTWIIFDAGSGIRELAEEILRRHKASGHPPPPIIGHILFSHLHWDHVQGFPFFLPAFLKGNTFHLYGSAELPHTIHQILSGQMSRPNFPVSLDSLPGERHYHNVVPGTVFEIDHITVRTKRLNHPCGTMGFRLDCQGKTLVYATDTEQMNEDDPSLLEFVRQADVLIFDSMYTPEQYLGLDDNISRQSWGHSTWVAAVRLAKAAEVKQLVLFHHGNTDDVVEEMEKRARELFPQTLAAYEGLVLHL